MNIKPENKLENNNKPIINNNEMLTDISPVHPHEGSVYKMYEENITSFDSILDSPDNFTFPSNNNPKNKFTQHIADTKLYNINSYANKEKEKELFKKSKLESQRNSNNNNQANSNNDLNTINKGIDLYNLKTNNNINNNNIAIGSSKNLDDLAQKDFIPLSKMEGKTYSKKSQSNTQQYMNSHKKAHAKISLINNALLNNSSSVIEINYNQNQTDEEEKEKTIRNKNDSQSSIRNYNDNLKTTRASFATEVYKNSKISSILNIDLYKEVTPRENIKKRSSKSKESSLVREKDTNNNNNNSSKIASENSNNSKHYHKIRNIYPFGSNNSKNNTAGRKRLNNSNTELNSNNININNSSHNSNKDNTQASVGNHNEINAMSSNYGNFKQEIRIEKPERKDENKNSILLNNEIKNEKTFKIDNLNRNSSNETIGKEGEIQTNIPLNSVNSDNSNKNVLVIRGSRIDQPNIPNAPKEEDKNLLKTDEKAKTMTNQNLEDQQEFTIPKHRYNTSKDTGFLSITATEEYLDFMNLNNTKIKATNNIIPNNNNNPNENNEKRNLNLINNSNPQTENKELHILTSEKANQDLSATNINNNIFSSDNNTSRSIFRHDFASLYNPYTSHILSLGGKADVISRKYSIETNSWTAIREMKVERSDFIALMYKEKRILIMGGKSLNYNGIESVSDTIDLLSTDEQSIVRLDFKLKIPRSNFGAVYHEYKLFVAGGYNGRDALSNFEYFDKKSKKWIDLPKMFNKKKEFAMILGLANNVYCLGGSDERE